MLDPMTPYYIMAHRGVDVVEVPGGAAEDGQRRLRGGRSLSFGCGAAPEIAPAYYEAEPKTSSGGIHVTM